jgi:hypothetical protein
MIIYHGNMYFILLTIVENSSPELLIPGGADALSQLRIIYMAHFRQKKMIMIFK